MYIIRKYQEIMRRLYAWSEKWAKEDSAEKALAAMSFAESSFFPIPPDPLLMTIVFQNTKAWRRAAAITTISSVLGGLFGYFIGFALFEVIGDWVVQTYHLQEEFDNLGETFQSNGTLTIFTAALTPIPYKVFTISAGAFGLNLVTFIVASILGRGLRFFVVAGLASVLGKKFHKQIERYIDRVGIAIVAIIVILFIITR